MRPAWAVSWWKKAAQFIFKINKGVESVFDTKEVNRFMEESKRPVPFSRMIYPIGIMPIVLSIRDKGKIINPVKAVFFAFGLMFLFFFVGDWILNLFGVDINSFAVAGSIVIFLMALEMVLDIEIFKDSSIAANDATIVPLVFPLLAGAGSFTTLLSLKAEYAPANILMALVLNAIVVFAMLSATSFLIRLLFTDPRRSFFPGEQDRPDPFCFCHLKSTTHIFRIAGST